MARSGARHFGRPLHLKTPLGTLRSIGWGPLPRRDTWLEAGYYSLIYITSGRGEYRDNRQGEKLLDPGGLIRLMPGTRWLHQPLAGGEMHELFVSFEGPIFDLWRSKGLLGDQPPVVSLLPVEHWSHRIRALARMGSGGTSGPLQAMATLQALLADMHDYRRSHDPSHRDRNWLRRARRALEGEDLGRIPPLAQVASGLNMSYETFRKRFARLSGQSPSRYQFLHRIEAAKQMLLRFSPSNQELAAACGFRDEYHFSRRFKQATGKTPSEYRK